MTGLNDTVPRSFTIPGRGPTATDYRFMDGIEVSGRVSLSYNAAVPEPSALLLACIGVFGFLACNWKKRK